MNKEKRKQHLKIECDTVVLSKMVSSIVCTFKDEKSIHIYIIEFKYLLLPLIFLDCIRNMTSTNNNSNPIVNNASSRLFSLDPSQRIQLDLYANESIDEQSSKIYEALKDDMFCIRLKQLVWEHMYCEKQLQLASTSSTNAIVPSEIKAKIKQCMQQYGYKNVMHNVVTRTYERIRMNSMRLSELAHSQVSNASVYARRSIDERNETIREVRMQWERGINEELLAIGMELKRKFAICRYIYMLTVLLCTCRLAYCCIYLFIP